ALSAQPAASAEPSDEYRRGYEAGKSVADEARAELKACREAFDIVTRYGRPAGDAQPVAWHVNDKALGKTYITQSATAASMAVQDGGSARPLVYSDSALAAHKPDGGDARDAERYRWLRNDK